MLNQVFRLVRGCRGEIRLISAPELPITAEIQSRNAPIDLSPKVCDSPTEYTIWL